MEKNLFLIISQFQNHSEAWKYLSICKTLRILFIDHMPRIVKYILELKTGIPKWCYAPIIVDIKINHTYPLGPEQFLTGGAVVQLLFDKVWPESDIDIFQQSEREFRKKRQRVDLIFKNQQIQTVLSGFDLSICQIGILNKIVYATPLFLYTQRYREIVCTVSDLSSVYVGIFMQGRNLQTSLRRMFEHHTTHLTYHNPRDFIDCVRCKDSQVFMDPECSMYKWFRRIEKYRRRFPDFTISYY
jgi:hypothetical protein